jgi:division protein CdvB (Snf7/Vps24/ESCRT-III family)
MDKNIPSKRIRSNNKLPWFNKKIKKMLKKKQSLYNQAKITKKVVKLQILPKRMQTTNTERRMELHK